MSIENMGMVIDFDQFSKYIEYDYIANYLIT